MFTVASPNLKKKMSITEFMPLPWENEPEKKKKKSRSEALEMFKKWDKLEFKKKE